MNEDSKKNLLQIILIALIVFIATYLGFYVAIKHHIKNLINPFYHTDKMEKMLIKQEREFARLNEKMMNNPFEPKMRPMFVNLIKEPSEYKVIVDLSQFDEDEKAITIETKEKELIIKGQMDKNTRGREKIINFTQTYYLDENIDDDKITKERKGNKYIITIPFED